MAGARGIRASALRVAAHLSALGRLQKELARTELEGKGGKAAGGGALAFAAGLLALYAVGFGLACLTAALAIVLDLWLALLIVFLLLLALVVGLALGARALFRSAAPLKPEQALEEARLTKELLRSFRGG